MKQPSILNSEPSKLMLRWHGREEGPLSLQEVERRLANSEIGLLHEVQYQGKWILLRSFLEIRNAQQNAARISLEEEEIRAREETERLAREREAQQNAEMLAEEKRKNDLLEVAIRSAKLSGGTGGFFAQFSPRVRHATVFALLFILGFAVYSVLQQRAAATRAVAEAVKIQAEKQAEAANVAAAASVINTVIEGAVEASKPAPVIINNR